jgi:hypothetical protein
MTKPARLRLTRPEPSEADVLASVLQYLELLQRQGRVAWYARMNSGAGRLVDRYGQVSQWTRWGFVGLPDILGQLPDGRLLALEVKRPSGRVSDAQARFLDVVVAGQGVGAVVRSVADVERLAAGWRYDNWPIHEPG